MNPSSLERPSEWQRTTARRFLKWLFTWRGARRSLMAVATLVTLIGLYYAEEDFRGKCAWEKCRREIEVDGTQLDWRAFISKPVPDEQNFAATPFIKSWYVRSNYTFVFSASKRWKNDDYGRAMAAVCSLEAPQKDGYRHFMDLATWGAAFDAIRSGELAPNHSAQSGPLASESRSKAAPLVLAGLESNAAVFAELQVASQRPYARYPINYDVPDPAEILLPHLNSLRAICRRLQLKACAELALGRSDEALEDVKLSFSVADSVKGEPDLISYLVRLACLQITTQPIWEGLAEHAWSEDQLHELETQLQSHNFVADLKPTFDAERSWGLGIIDYLKHTGKFAELSNGTGSVVDWLDRMVPSGWYDQEKVSYCRLFQAELAGTFEGASKRVFPNRTKSNEQVLDREFRRRNPLDVIFVRHQVLSAMLLPALPAVIRKGATAQVATDQAAIACALERYRLANGQFPDTLDALVPQFIPQLPHDVINGEPYKYRRTDDGQFVLYSVGWNEKDDGGVPGKTLFDEKDGDWVWQYPPPEKP